MSAFFRYRHLCVAPGDVSTLSPEHISTFSLIHISVWHHVMCPLFPPSIFQHFPLYTSPCGTRVGLHSFSLKYLRVAPVDVSTLSPIHISVFNQVMFPNFPHYTSPCGTERCFHTGFPLYTSPCGTERCFHTFPITHLRVAQRDVSTLSPLHICVWHQVMYASANLQEYHFS